MAGNADFDAVFNALKRILEPVADQLKVVADEGDNYYLDTHHIMPNKKPLFFGAVQTRKNYVSFHLMPVYVNPDLKKDMSESLRKRMQGKSCFNFKTVETIPHEELKALTLAGLADYRRAGYVSNTD